MSSDFWNGRWSMARYTTAGHVGELQKWRWSIIEKYYPKLESIIDLCCGDGKFNSGKAIPELTGVDFSKYAIDKAKESYPQHSWICADIREHNPRINADLVILYDVLFHIEKFPDLEKILLNALSYAKKFVIFNEWYENPFVEKVTDEMYQYFHHATITDIVERLAQDNWQIFAQEKIKRLDPHSLYYVLKKKG